MSREPDNRATSEEPATGPDVRADVLAVLRRVETLLTEIRGRLDTATRERRYQEFSVARLIAWFVQLLALGVVVAAIVNWVYGETRLADQVVTLVFAGVLQLGALTAFSVAPGRGRH